MYSFQRISLYIRNNFQIHMLPITSLEFLKIPNWKNLSIILCSRLSPLKSFSGSFFKSFSGIYIQFNDKQLLRTKSSLFCIKAAFIPTFLERVRLFLFVLVMSTSRHWTWSPLLRRCHLKSRVLGSFIIKLLRKSFRP